MRVLLADAHKRIRSALKLMLEQQPGFEVVGEAASATSLPALVIDLQPDVVLLDWELHDGELFEILSDLQVLYPHLKVVGMSARPEHSQAALDAGADAFISKVNSPKDLLNALIAIRGSIPASDDQT